MPILPSQTPEADILAFMRGWLDLLAAGRLEEACLSLDEPAGNGHRWTPGSILGIVNETFRPGTRFFVDHPEGPRFTAVEMFEGTLGADVVAYDDGSGFSGEHDVPLNDSCSDLTAIFDFRWHHGALRVRLDDLTVL
jgi:hypothetical protein